MTTSTSAGPDERDVGFHGNAAAVAGLTGLPVRVVKSLFVLNLVLCAGLFFLLLYSTVSPQAPPGVAAAFENGSVLGPLVAGIAMALALVFLVNRRLASGQHNS